MPSVLAAVMEVKVETAVVSGAANTNNVSPGAGYLAALACAVLAGAAGATGAALYCVQQRRRARSMSNLPLPATSDTCHRHHDDEKSNNLQNEENLRRFVILCNYTKINFGQHKILIYFFIFQIRKSFERGQRQLIKW